jgi:hypothetical protein
MRWSSAALLAEGRRQLFLGGQGDLAFGQRALAASRCLAQIFQFRRQAGDLFLGGAFAGFESFRRAVRLRAFATLRAPARQAFDLEHHGLNFLMQQAV